MPAPPLRACHSWPSVCPVGARTVGPASRDCRPPEVPSTGDLDPGGGGVAARRRRLHPRPAGRLRRGRLQRDAPMAGRARRVGLAPRDRRVAPGQRRRGPGTVASPPGSAVAPPPAGHRFHGLGPGRLVFHRPVAGPVERPARDLPVRLVPSVAVGLRTVGPDLCEAGPDPLVGPGNLPRSLGGGVQDPARPGPGRNLRGGPDHRRGGPGPAAGERVQGVRVRTAGRRLHRPGPRRHPSHGRVGGGQGAAPDRRRG